MLDRARIKGAKAAIAEIERVQHQMAEQHGNANRSADVAARIMDQYRVRIDSLTQPRMPLRRPVLRLQASSQ